MKLNQKALADRTAWSAAGIKLPAFDREKAKLATLAAPAWVHFGGGNIFRAFQAALQQKLLEDGAVDTGIVVAEGYDYEIIDLMYRPHDDLSLLVTLKADGTIEKMVIASVVESRKLNSADEAEFGRLREIFRCPSLQMASFTITEKGYSLTRGDDPLPDVAVDFTQEPFMARSYIGKIAALCYERYRAGALPIAMVSMDNCSHNGDRLRAAVRAFAEAWQGAGLAQAGFLAYLDDPAKVSFPWSMIDKITPRPDDGVKAMLKDCGFEDVESVATSKMTFVAPFVNAEETQYLVIEDSFPNGRPPLEKAGVMFASRQTVDNVERMKVCTCLNPLHTAMSLFGCMLGYTRISDEMRDADIVALIKGIGYREGLPVVVDPGVLNPKTFIDAVVNVRLPNPFMPDTPQRIATDTSQKLAIRFGQTIKAYLADGALDVQNLTLIPLVQAAWCRYLMGVDDRNQPFEVSPDPLLPAMAERFGKVKLGEKADVHALLAPVFSNADIFGVNLYEAGLGERAETYFERMIARPGAVRATLHDAVN